MGIQNYIRARKKLGTLLAVTVCCSAFAHDARQATRTAKPHHSYHVSEYQQPGIEAKIRGERIAGIQGIRTSTKRLMQHTRKIGAVINYGTPLKYACVDRSFRRLNPHAPEVAIFPGDKNLKNRIINVDELDAEANNTRDPIYPHTYGISFSGGMLSQVNMFPPDAMGAVGPKQYIVAINGLVKSFDKNTGQPDGILNISTDNFFESVRNGYGTSDPRIRFDRHSGRWFIVMVNIENPNNRIMIGASDTGIITHDTGWTFFSVEAGANTFFDFPTLGIDPHALYIGGITLSNNDTGEVFVVNKKSLLKGSADVTVFHNIINPVTRQGPYAPCGVDNFDAHASEGYFIGVDSSTFGTLIALRVNDPDSDYPTISGNIPITIPATQFPVSVPHLGNMNPNLGNLDGLDDRLFAAHIRNGQLWTAHTVGVDNDGVSSNMSSVTRNGCRWYAIDMSTTLPQLTQAGTLYADSQTNSTDQRSYWIPSVMTNGQGHMALGCSAAGAQEYANAATSGRFADSQLGTLQNISLYTSSTNSYNPAGDPGSADRAKRWGSTSYTCVDPNDDMTMWTIQEYCNAPNSWAARVVKLLAPPPATPISASPASIPRGRASISVKITGEDNGKSGYFDTGLGFNSRLSALVGGNVIVNSITWISPTEVTLDLSTMNATSGAKNVTIRNPDGQSVAARLITVL